MGHIVIVPQPFAERKWSRLATGWKMAAVLCGAVLFPSAGLPAEESPKPSKILTPGNHYLAVKMEERDRHYIAHVPPTYDVTRPMPVVIMLHRGSGSARNAMLETAWTRKADTSGFLAVFPEGTSLDPSEPPRAVGNPRTWNDGSGRFASEQFKSAEYEMDDVAFVNALIDDLVARFTVDGRRVFVTGFSDGASMAFRLGVELANRIAAVAPVSGYLWLKNPKLSRPVSLLYMVGSNDPFVPLDGGKVRVPWVGPEKRPPVRESVLKWAEMLGCPPERKVFRDSNGVKVTAYGPGRNGSEAVFYIVEGMGHTWPGGKRLLPERLVGKTTNKIKANDVIWEFFQKHPKR